VFLTREDRKTNRLRLKAELETVLTTRSARDWAEELNSLGVPAGAVLSVPEALATAQITDRDFITRFNSVPGVDRPVDVVSVGAMFDGTRPTVSTPPPKLGQDTTSILENLGYSRIQIETLRREGVI
jgi:formyl-CoA transferase